MNTLIAFTSLGVVKKNWREKGRRTEIYHKELDGYKKAVFKFSYFVTFSIMQKTTQNRYLQIWSKCLFLIIH